MQNEETELKNINSKYSNFNSENFQLIRKRDKKTGEIIAISLNIINDKINILSKEELNFALDKQIKLEKIIINEESFLKLDINNAKSLLEKAEQIIINQIDYNKISKYTEKINMICNYNKNVSVLITEDFFMKERDYNILNNSKAKIVLPLKYSMWIDLLNINNEKVCFEYYSLNEMKELMPEILKIIKTIYSEYDLSLLDEKERLYLAFDYAKQNWKYEREKRTTDFDERGQWINHSLFYLLKNGKSMCEGMSDMFSLILNNSNIKVNANVVCGRCTSDGEPHAWINTLIENKVYENCLTKGCTTAPDGIGNIFSKLNYIYDIRDEFKIQKKLGLPLEYNEIPNARENLTVSTELKNKNNIYYNGYIITKIGILKKEDDKFIKLDKKDAVLILKLLMNDIKQKKIFLNLNQNMTINKLLSKEKMIVKVDSNFNEKRIIKVSSSQPISNNKKIIKVGAIKKINEEVFDESQRRKK